jgi:hypothetical protein
MPGTLLLFVALTGALVPACGDQTDPTDIDQAQPPSLRTDRNPEGPGAFVGKVDGQLTFIFPDPASGLNVTAGFTPEALAAFCARQPFEGQPSRIKGVVRPDSSFTDLTRARNVTLMVFVDDNQDVCDGPAPFAIGQGDFRNHDNDLFVSGLRGNSFGFRVVGQVTDVNGVRHHLSAAFHGIIYRDGSLRITRTGIVLR